MSYSRSNAVRGGTARSGMPASGRSLRSVAGDKKGDGKTVAKTADKTVAKTAAEIMKEGKKVEVADPYPGLEVILKKSRKEKPFLDTDAAQRARALQGQLPLGVLPAGREKMVARMEEDYTRAVAKWRADNWMLPVEKETEFPYSRTRNLVDPMFKYGAAWLPKNYDSGFSFDHEGEEIGFPQYMENVTRADIMEESDMRIKGLGTGVYDDSHPVLTKMKAENAGLKKEFGRVKFDRYKEMMRTHEEPGYTISGRFRAYKLFTREQQRLLEEWAADKTAEKKKALLDHVAAHGQLVRDVPEADPPAPKPKKEVVVQKKPVKVEVGSVLDVVQK